MLLHPKAVHHNVIKKIGWSFGNAPVAEIPRARVNRLRVPEHRSGSSHITAHGKLKALDSLFSLDHWVSSIERLCCAFSTYLPTGKS